MKKILIAEIVLLLLCLLYCFVPLHCEAAEAQTIVITSEQLTNLEVELNRAQKAIENSKANSEMLKNQLMELQQALTEAKQQSEKLKEQLATSKITLIQQQNQLANANQSLQTLSSEMKQEMQSLKRQRNVAYVVAACLLYAAVK